MADIQYWGTGRRKSSVARVRIMTGTGKFIVNKKELDEYFDYDSLKTIARSPLTVTGNEANYDVFVNVKGGGYTGQAGAIRHGLSRALLEANEEFRPTLKRAGFLTRDPRKVEERNTDSKGEKLSIFKR